MFGFIYDANGNSAAAVNLQGGSRTVLAPIPYPIPSGMSKVRTYNDAMHDTIGKTWATPISALFHRAITLSYGSFYRGLDRPMKKVLLGWRMFYQLCHSTVVLTYAFILLLLILSCNKCANKCHLVRTNVTLDGAY